MAKQKTKNKLKKIVFTGSPSSGKSSAIEALSQFSEKIVIVPETAALLLGGGYPPPAIDDLAQSHVFQKIIIDLQRSVESMFTLKNPHATHMILDRAILDGVGYWPKGPKAYLREFKLNVDRELKNYDYVVFFHTPEEKHFGGVNLKRFHNYEQSKEIGKKQFSVWKKHKNFIEIPDYSNFSKKVDHAVRIVREIVGT